MLKKPKVFKMTNMTEMMKVLTFLEGGRLDAVPWRRGQRVAQALIGSTILPRRGIIMLPGLLNLLCPSGI